MDRMFSIFLPVHNGGNYIKDCVNSILGQTYENFSLEILENKSTDGTAEWLKTIKDERVRIWPSDSLLKVEDNWKRILSIEKHEYMTIIGHDDIFYPDFLETINCAINDNNNIRLFCTHFDIIDENGEIIRKCLPISENEDLQRFLLMRLTFNQDSFGTGYVFRSADYDHVNGIPMYHKLLFADDALWLKLIADGWKYTNIHYHFAYRMHKNSMSQTKKTNDFVKALDQYVIFLKEIKEKYPQCQKILDRNFERYCIHFLGKTRHSAMLMRKYTGCGRMKHYKRVLKYFICSRVCSEKRL